MDEELDEKEIISKSTFEQDGDDSSDEDDSSACENDVKDQYNAFIKSKKKPGYLAKIDPNGYSFLAHAIGVQQLYSKRVNNAYYLLKEKLPTSKYLADDETLTKWIEESLIEALWALFKSIKKQEQASRKIYTNFIREESSFIEKIVEKIKNDKRTLFKQINSEAPLKKIEKLILKVQAKLENYVSDYKEDILLKDPPFFAIDDFSETIDTMIKAWLEKNKLLKANEKFSNKDERKAIKIDSKDKIGKIIYEEAKKTTGTTTFNSFTKPRPEILDLFCEKEIKKGADSLIEKSGKHYLFKSTATREKISQSDFKKIFDADDKELTNKYLPYNDEKLKKEILEKIKKDGTSLNFITALKNKKTKIKLERGLLLQQYTFRSDSIIGFYANIRLVMRLQKRRIRQGIDDGSLDAEEVFQAAWEFGNIPLLALEEQKISVSSRSDLVINAGTYSEISESLQKYKDHKNAIATWIKNLLFLDNDKLNSEMKTEKVDKQDIIPLKKLIINLSYLLLGCEVQRNPASLVTHHMMLELIEESQLTWEEALANPEYKESCSGGDMPMSMGKYKTNGKHDDEKIVGVKSEAVQCARVLQKHYGLFAIKKWEYKGDLANEKAGTRDYDHITELLKREKNIVATWLEFKKLNKKNDSEKIAAIIEMVKIVEDEKSNSSAAVAKK